MQMKCTCNVTEIILPILIKFGVLFVGFANYLKYKKIGGGGGGAKKMFKMLPTQFSSPHR